MEFHISFPPKDDLDHPGFYTFTFHHVQQGCRTQKLTKIGTFALGLGLRIPIADLYQNLYKYNRAFGTNVVSWFPERDIKRKMEDIVNYVKKDSGVDDIELCFFPNKRFKALRRLI